MSSIYRTILADPPWRQTLMGRRRRAKDPRTRQALDYPTLGLEEIKSLPVQDFAVEGCHLWLWTTNQFLEAGFSVMRAWGFNYLAPVTWVKPSGTGNYFVHTTQTLLFGYFRRCRFPLRRYLPTHFFAPTPREHSRKPEESYRLIESISPGPRLELFARPVSALFPKRVGWDVWGNEVESDVDLSREALGQPLPECSLVRVA